MRAAGWETVLWSSWGRDWRARATPATVAREAAGSLRGGDIILLHDSDAYSAPGSWRTTIAALPAILAAIAAAGLRPQRLDGASRRVTWRSPEARIDRAQVGGPP